MQRAPPDARVDIERGRDRHNRAIQDVVRRVVWPTKFKPDLPPRYDGKNSPLEFLQLYTLAIQATGGDDKVMANWFPMAVKDSASSWLTNLPAESINTW